MMRGKIALFQRFHADWNIDKNDRFLSFYLLNNYKTALLI
ncbi:hypothetical protein l11_17310 [Neisseria weaveri LMG 5135]|nr:hypothetical protein l11_17310 [Neisseria weaveri LMG 5135]EGV38499.1 hypothetical protein l13_00320 [Neisseria weaveri ATCC 51223]